MAEEMDGEEFVVDKILDKRVRNGKIEYYLSWKVKILDQSYIIMILHREGQAWNDTLDYRMCLHCS